MNTKLSLKARRHAISAIIEARFSVSAFEEVRPIALPDLAKLRK